MFILDGNRLALDRPFSHEGFQYPKEWLRCSSQEQRADLGIIELSGDTPRDEWDQDKERVRAGIIKQQRTEAHRILSQTDWYIIRQLETGTEIPPEVSVFRQEVREVCSQNIERLELSADPSATNRGLARYPILP